MNFIRTNRYFFILFCALLIGIQVVSANGLFQNNLLKIDMCKTTTGGIKLTLYTSKPYKDAVKLIQKGDPQYVVLLPETSASPNIKPSLKYVSDIVTSVDIKTQPYINNFKGYTKITLVTTKNVQISTQVQTLNASGASTITKSNKNTQQVIKKQAAPTVLSKNKVTAVRKEMPKSYKATQPAYNRIQKVNPIKQISKNKVNLNKSALPKIVTTKKVISHTNPIKQQEKSTLKNKKTIVTKRVTTQTTSNQQQKSIQNIKKTVTIKKPITKVEQPLTSSNNVTMTKHPSVAPAPVTKAPVTMPAPQVKTITPQPAPVPTTNAINQNNSLNLLNSNWPAIALVISLLILLFLLFKMLKKQKPSIQQQQNPVMPSYPKETTEEETNIESPTYTQTVEQAEVQPDVPEGLTYENDFFNEEIFSEDIISKEPEMDKTSEDIFSETDFFETIEEPSDIATLPEQDSQYDILDELSTENLDEDVFGIEPVAELQEESSALDELNEMMEKNNIEEEENLSIDELLGEEESIEEFDYAQELEQEITEQPVEPKFEDAMFEQAVIEEVTKEEVLEPETTPEIGQEEEPADEFIKSEFVIDDEKGFYLVDFENSSALVGHIDERIFVLKKFNQKVQEPLQVRLDEQKAKSTSYIAKVGKYRALVDVTADNMSLLIEL